MNLASLISASVLFIRINQVGYLPDAPKIAVACLLERQAVESFTVIRLNDGARVFGPAQAKESKPFGPCLQTYRLDFSGLKTPGTYIVVAANTASPALRIGNDVYRGAADTLLAYMRQQRSGWNPLFRDSTHKKDGILVDHPTRSGEFIKASGGWADAADYLQYVTTSAYATYIMLRAHRDHPRASADRFLANGLPGSNGVPDILDEARWGLQWLLQMFPERDLMLNQLADDRDHAYWDLPTTDTSDYGWGKGQGRPLYPCTGKPQGLFKYKNRATGKASTAGKYAAAFALGAQVYAQRDPQFARKLSEKAQEAYDVGIESPGACQTAPGVSPYFYEEDNWADDMELGAAELYALTRKSSYLADAMRFAQMEPHTPWFGRDTANHYQWFPWHNNGHYVAWRNAGSAQRAQLARMYREGIEKVIGRADNGFRIGIPFIWCSNNLMASFATQAYLYRTMTGERQFIEYEQAALDWLFGTNPWGTSMIIGFPANGRVALKPHSVVADRMGVWTQKGGMLDGPVYRSIFQNLRGIRLIEPDVYEALNTGHIVYHDDMGDYSTNEPIMDGTANLTYLLSALAR